MVVGSRTVYNLPTSCQTLHTPLRRQAQCSSLLVSPAETHDSIAQRDWKVNLCSQKTTMMWFRIQLVTVFALVLVTVSAMKCNVTNVKPFDAKVITGEYYYTALSTKGQSRLSAISRGFSATLHGDSIRIGYYEKSHRSKHCPTKEYSCEIKDNRCVGEIETVYIIDYDSKFIVIYSSGSKNNGDLEIYTKDAFDYTQWTAITDLPSNFRETISKVCGKKAINTDTYQQFPVINFIPVCEK